MANRKRALYEVPMVFSTIFKAPVERAPERLFAGVIPYVEAHPNGGVREADLRVWISIGKGATQARCTKGLIATAESESWERLSVAKREAHIDLKHLIM